MIVIKDVYEKFKRDVGVDIELPKLQTKREENENAYWIAKVEECTNDIAIISFGKIFYDKTMQEGYLISSRIRLFSAYSTLTLIAFSVGRTIIAPWSLE